MTDTQLYLALAIPVFAIVTSLIVSLVQVSGIREDMRGMRTEFHGDFASLHSDITNLTGKVNDIYNVSKSVWNTARPRLRSLAGSSPTRAARARASSRCCRWPDVA